ncbi:class I SAM-dependent methyltransferase [Phaeobacter gallaeciensis]|uniref:class I SAM-dependent methyltransferase n=1 Tax=Phaeobacter gallaeciensis TaxID=60890 RepID=UPI00237FA3CA|nr:class I SAM-dependent methyltransferase [Phaeobacter gallaeciensis]MDE4302837.1 class I SAM-dependent methyltransferase [Phaeobacter gallaeciensis]MDE4334308.1 class I SAM-dependent methyltransferase [Phaeobacter gallaeciensis]MDE4351697.1 class I SAM-dependent methyltransferase [Phaeobacter gallaeciensis]MDE4360626.1 class I SAM-dependent methyltransferase [Phaeobacter gallaeciensis]MDE4369723.1 class I SAM-dependent methyltransferase [Phaeobacter gallaeciensis]
MKQFETFLADYDQQFSKQADGGIKKATEDFQPVASLRILSDMRQRTGLTNLPSADPCESLSQRIAQWVMDASPEQRALADLAIPMPPAGVHHVPGQLPVFYDFKNTDIVLDELQMAGVSVQGRLLDFGCSSGRNLAVLRRAFPNDLVLFGSDPAALSIQWLTANVPGVQADINNQMPPLPYADASFEIIIAKSIWTHFSPEACLAWFSEVKRILAPGGHFLFSTHGPHDIASRVMFDVPRPKYERFAGHEHWTRDEFLLDLISNMDENGHYFQPYKAVDHQGDLKHIKNAVTDDWGLMFMTEDYLRSMLPNGLRIIKRSIGRTGNRHDVYVVRRD